jgi:Poly(ADP-ribose) polymerase and DNA-Ligase Zn-finger region
MIEVAKSGRSTCRSCRNTIAKGELRLGEETENSFGDDASYRWHHMKCAASKVPDALRAALATFTDDVPDRAEIDQLLAEADAKRPPPFPHADHAPTGRARCLECGEAIQKGDLRVVIEREVEVGMSVRKSAGSLHPKCAAAHAQAQGTTHDELTEAIRKNTRGLSDDDLDALFSVV